MVQKLVALRFSFGGELLSFKTIHLFGDPVNINPVFHNPSLPCNEHPRLSIHLPRGQGHTYGPTATYRH
jgi:hypothetical protein